ncbi:hypothetical protein ACFYOW_44335 [Nocardia sp. NPDC006982]
MRAHQHAAGARRDGDGQKHPPGGVEVEPADHALGCSRGGWTTILHLACEQGLRPLLDEHQVRTWTSWRRWTLLCLLALAVLTALAVRAAASTTDTAALSPLTRNEIRHLLVMQTPPIHSLKYALAWSTWRRRHQHQALLGYYQRRTGQAA